MRLGTRGSYVAHTHINTPVFVGGCSGGSHVRTQSLNRIRSGGTHAPTHGHTSVFVKVSSGGTHARVSSEVVLALCMHARSHTRTHVFQLESILGVHTPA